MTPAEEIKNKLDIVEVLRDYIPLKPAGTNFKANCPFHNEKTPSFMVSHDKQIWHCFGCGKGGDVFTFIEEIEGVDFVEAMKLLAPKAGVVLKRQDPKKMNQRNRLLDILNMSARFYQSLLSDGKESEKAVAYLKERGLTGEVARDWEVGFARNSWDDLVNYLRQKGFQDRDIVSSGMAIAKSGSSRIYNRFRNRIMFPLYDATGNIVGFTGRTMPGSDDAAKYINTPQTAVYDKGKTLYGLFQAKNAIRQKDEVIIVEGQMDVITAHQYGYKNTVASSGTALTEDQARLLGRYTDNFVFALDADEAGQEATERAGEVIDAVDEQTVEGVDRFGRIRKFIDPGRSYKKDIKVALLPSGKDPDECIRKDKEGWDQAIENASPLMQYYFDKVLNSLDVSKLDGRKKAAKKLLPMIARLHDVVERNHWLKELSSHLDIDTKYLAEAMPSPNRQSQPRSRDKPTAKPAAEEQKNRQEILSEILLALVLRFPVFIRHMIDYIQPEEIAGQHSQGLYKSLILFYNQSTANQEDNLADFSLDYNDFKQFLTEDEQDSQLKLLNKLVILGDKDFSSYQSEQANKEIKQIIRELKRHYLSSRLKEVSKLIGKAEKESDKAELESLLEEFNNLSQELKNLLD